MKAIKYFLYALIATFVFAGCSDDPTYTRGESEADGCYGVYFPSQDNAADLELDPADPATAGYAPAVARTVCTPHGRSVAPQAVRKRLSNLEEWMYPSR